MHAHTKTHKRGVHFLILGHTPEYAQVRCEFEIPQACVPISIIWVYLGTV